MDGRKGEKQRGRGWIDGCFLLIDRVDVVDKHCTATDELRSVFVYLQIVSMDSTYDKMSK